MSKSHTKKGWKADRDLVAGTEPYEVDTVQDNYDVPEHVVKELIKEFGHSRTRLYAILEEKGYKKKEKPAPENTDTPNEATT